MRVRDLFQLEAVARDDSEFATRVRMQGNFHPDAMTQTLGDVLVDIQAKLLRFAQSNTVRQPLALSKAASYPKWTHGSSRFHRGPEALQWAPDFSIGRRGREND